MLLLKVRISALWTLSLFITVTQLIHKQFVLHEMLATAGHPGRKGQKKFD